MKYKCLEIALNNDHIKILQYLLHFKPELKSEEATNLFRIVFEKTFLRYRLNYSFDLIESLLKKFKVDLNSEINEYSSSTFISYTSVSKNFHLLRLFEKYGHDYTDTALPYEEMTSSDFLPVYIYKKPFYLRSSSENKNKNHSFYFSSENKNKNHLCPLKERSSAVTAPDDDQKEDTPRSKDGDKRSKKKLSENVTCSLYPIIPNHLHLL